VMLIDLEIRSSRGVSSPDKEHDCKKVRNFDAQR